MHPQVRPSRRAAGGVDAATIRTLAPCSSACSSRTTGSCGGAARAAGCAQTLTASCAI
ncbi:MAG: hypothetical protein MZW92_20050 [Comamonadaceae bacterium]|nr:hypothetical protein [Comamonadaceae bacterium]